MDTTTADTTTAGPLRQGPRRMTRRAVALSVSGGLMAALATACQPPGRQPASAPGTQPAGGAEQRDLAPRQEFRANLGGEPPGLDPNLAAWADSIAVINIAWEGLLKFAPDLKVQPALASEVPSISNGGISQDGLTYTFKLRPDARWSDGRPVTAADFVFGVKHLLDPRLAADYASSYFAIVGAEEMYTARAGTDAEVDALFAQVGVKAVDERTFQVQLKRRQATFLQLAALWPMFPLREDVWKTHKEQWTEPQNYISTGPFRMTEWVHRDHITLVPNQHYYGTKPALQKITLTMVTDPNANYAAYLNNERDVVSVPPQNIPVVQNDPNLRTQILRYDEPTTFGLRFNVAKPPFDNVQVRQALAMAIDRETFIRNVQRGLGKPAYSWLPPGIPGHDPNLGKEFAFNPEKAKQTLAAAGYPDGRGLPPLSLQYANTGTNPQVAEFVQAQLKQHLGIDLRLEPMEPRAFSELVNRKEHSWAWFGWHADYPDPENWLPDIWGCNGGNNKTNYCNPQFDALMRQAVAELDDARRLQLWQQAERILVQDQPSVFLFYREVMYLVKPHVQGLRPNILDSRIPGGRFLHEVWIKRS